MSSYDGLHLLSWTAGLGAVTAEALAVRQGCTVASARGYLEQACRRGVLTRARPLRDQPALYTVTPRGLRAAHACRLTPCRVTNSNAHHLIICARVAVALESRHPDHRVEGERELRALELEAGQPLASSRVGIGPDGLPRTHRPDLVLWPRDKSDLPVAVEVELTVKSPERLVALSRAWARCQLVAGVLYYALPEPARALERAITRAHAGDRILVVALAQVCRPVQSVPSAP